MEDWKLPLATGNVTQQAQAQMNTDFSSDMPGYHNTHERYRFRKPRRMTDSIDAYPGQQCVPAKSELSELVDPYSSENPYWEQPSCDDDLPDNPSWSTTPTPRPDTFIAKTTPPDNTTTKQKADDRKNGVRAPETETRNTKRRKSSTFIYYAGTEDKEQRRIRHIVKNLQIFEKQQRMYGRQQLKAIKDGIV
ncbi:hypothetical protein J3E69DRAFT_335539 [Trichoderma sp. SZMC 28015]